MAATKRKPMRSTARKAGKKAPARKVGKAKGRKMKATARKSATLKLVKMPPVTSVDKPFTKNRLYSIISGRTGVNRKDVSSVFEELGSIIAAHLKKQGPGQFTLPPGLVKMVVIYKPATKARKGTNPFTGEEMMFKAKPARYIVKVRALKKLKAMV